MEGLVAVAILVGLLSVPFLIGRVVGSVWVGLVLVSSLPVVLAIVGDVSYQDARESADSETRAWAGLSLVLVIYGAVLEVLGVAAWGFGRLIRQSRPSPRRMPKGKRVNRPRKRVPAG